MAVVTSNLTLCHLISDQLYPPVAADHPANAIYLVSSYMVEGENCWIYLSTIDTWVIREEVIYIPPLVLSLH